MNLSTYQNLIEKVGLSKLDAANKDTYNIVKEGSANFTDPNLWNEMLADADIKEAYELHVKKLESLAESKPASMKVSKSARPKRSAKKKKYSPQSIIWEGAKTEYRPERMRVNFIDGNYLVQTFSESQNKWINQKEHADERAAVNDAKDWYKKPVTKTKVKRAAKKVAKAKQPATSPKFPVTVKKLSKELQLIKRMANMDGKRKTVGSVTSLQRDVANILKTGPDRKSILTDINSKMKDVLEQATNAGVKELDIKLGKEFKEQLLKNVADAKPKIKVEFLGGVDEKKK